MNNNLPQTDYKQFSSPVILYYNLLITAPFHVYSANVLPATANLEALKRWKRRRNNNFLEISFHLGWFWRKSCFSHPTHEAVCCSSMKLTLTDYLRRVPLEPFLRSMRTRRKTGHLMEFKMISCTSGVLQVNNQSISRASAEPLTDEFGSVTSKNKESTFDIHESYARLQSAEMWHFP